MQDAPHITWRGGTLRAIKAKHMRRYLPNKRARPEQDPRAIAAARLEIVEFILTVQNARDLSLRQAVISFAQRTRERRLAPHLIAAVITANGRPSRTASVTLSNKTLFRWIKLYKMSRGQVKFLAPIPTKTLYANDNFPMIRTK